jgi:predicted ArsR family transcriptional regulator
MGEKYDTSVVTDCVVMLTLEGRTTEACELLSAYKEALPHELKSWGEIKQLLLDYGPMTAPELHDELRHYTERTIRRVLQKVEKRGWVLISGYVRGRMKHIPLWSLPGHEHRRRAPARIEDQVLALLQDGEEWDRRQLEQRLVGLGSPTTLTKALNDLMGKGLIIRLKYSHLDVRWIIAEGNEHRRRPVFTTKEDILRTLARYGTMTLVEVGLHLPYKQATLQQHMNELYKEGLVIRRECAPGEACKYRKGPIRGKIVIWSLSPDAARDVVELLHREP